MNPNTMRDPVAGDIVLYRPAKRTVGERDRALRDSVWATPNGECWLPAIVTYVWPAYVGQHSMANMRVLSNSSPAGDEQRTSVVHAIPAEPDGPAWKFRQVDIDAYQRSVQS